jgi:hypothetical protein
LAISPAKPGALPACGGDGVEHGVALLGSRGEVPEWSNGAPPPPIQIWPAASR